MKMSENEYKQLIRDFMFLNDKVADCYKRECDQVLEELKREYEKYIVRY